MRFFAMATAGLLLFGGAAFADPPKADPKQPAPRADSQPRPATLMLASAETVRGLAETAPTPVKRRVAPRVTTCRCGDPQTPPNPDGE